MELIHIKGKTYYFKGPVSIGVNFIDDKNIILIDSGSDSSYGKKILRYFDERNIKIKAIINTHSHADHCGGNNYLQKKTNCHIYATRVEAALINNPLIEPLYLFSSAPIKELENKFLQAEESNVSNEIKYGQVDIFGNELNIIDLKGHSLGMIGIITKDNVFFTADSLFEEKIIDKYKILYCMDLEKEFSTLNLLSGISCEYYVLSHGGLRKNINQLIDVNRCAYEKINKMILENLHNPMTREEILMKICNDLNLHLNVGQYFLNSSAISCHISYLSNNGLIEHEIINNNLFWKKRN